MTILLRVVITGERTGKKALLCEKPGREGRRRFVPVYLATATTDGVEVFQFTVTRDSSDIVFGHSINRFGQNGECPPSKEDQPYHGIIREDGPKGFRIEFFEDENARTLYGTGYVLRKNLQIHFGAAASHGCLLVAGRRRDYRSKFVIPMRELLGDGNVKIEVVVLPR